jgi:hypothetical protein
MKHSISCSEHGKPQKKSINVGYKRSRVSRTHQQMFNFV